ncbi:MAG: PadR family transcriptional regulator [Gemmatimonadaceae bacterium]
MTERPPLLKGTLDLLVLKALTLRSMHGLEVSEWIDDRGEGDLEVLDSALYQALYRLEARGLVAAEWGVTDNNRRARYYQITPAGRVQLEKERASWLLYAQRVQAILALRTRSV